MVDDVRNGAAQPASAPVESNARLTALTGIALLVLLAVEGVTIVSIRRLLPLHYFVGLLVIPPVLLKLASTGTRFVRYYTGDPRYRAAGPPSPILRLAGPVVVVSTIAVVGTGIELWLFGDRFGLGWLTAHKASFVVWFAVMAVHVLGHLERAPALAVRDVVNRPPVPGRFTRHALIGVSLFAGVMLAATTLVWQSPFVVPVDHG